MLGNRSGFNICVRQDRVTDLSLNTRMAHFVCWMTFANHSGRERLLGA